MAQESGFQKAFSRTGFKFCGIKTVFSIVGFNLVNQGARSTFRSVRGADSCVAGLERDRVIFFSTLIVLSVDPGLFVRSGRVFGLSGYF